jgi:hypothetical protein
MSGVVVLSLRLILAVCLYIFLGLALYLSWKELQIQGVNLTLRKTPLLHLTIQVNNAETVFRSFQLPEVSIGRDPACNILLEDEAVSARHAHFSFHHGQWWVEDLKSTNGTRLNQMIVNTPTVITTGDQIECGHSAIIVSIGASSNASPTKRL